MSTESEKLPEFLWFHSSGIGKHYSADECTKIVRKLTADSFLREELEQNQYSTVAYVKLGTKAQLLLNDFSQEKFYVVMDMKATLNPGSTPNTLPSGSNANEVKDDELKRLEEDCFSELKEAIAEHFPELKSVYAALPVDAYREIAEKLPNTQQKLLDIDQMTETRVQKYGVVIIGVCKQFIEKRMAYLADRATAEALEREDAFEAMEEPASSSGWIGKSG